MIKTTLIAMFAGLLLTGCFGGGGSSSSSVSSVAPVARNYNLLGLNSTVQFAVPPALASSKPKTQGGVVSQSSNVGSDNITQDLFKIFVSGNLNSANWELLYDANGNGAFATLYTAPDGVMTLTSSTSNADAHYRHRLHGVSVDMDGDGTNDGRLWARTHAFYSSATNTMVSDTDYLTSGWWLYAPSDSNSTNYAMGAFVSRDDVFNITSASGQATYAGRWSALYMSRSSAETGEIRGGITLNANFDTNKISGSMPFYGATLYGSSSSDPKSFYDGAFMLTETDIMSDSSFSGSGSGRLMEKSLASGETNSENATLIGTHNASVNWGGKFFGSSGEQPDEARGTFAGEIGGSNGVAFIGNFEASKQ